MSFLGKKKSNIGRGFVFYLIFNAQFTEKDRENISNFLFPLLTELFDEVNIRYAVNDYGHEIISIEAPYAKFEINEGSPYEIYLNIFSRIILDGYEQSAIGKCRIINYHIEFMLVPVEDPKKGSYDKLLIREPTGEDFDLIYSSLDSLLFQQYSNFEDKILRNKYRSLLEFGPYAESFDMDIVKKQEAEQPTHWIFKKVKSPINFYYRELALHESMLGQYHRCLATCITGLQMFPYCPYLLYMKGRTLGDIGNYDDGIEVLNRAISIYPHFADLYVERGSIMEKMHDIRAAKADYEKALEIEPTIQIPKINR